MKSEGAIRQKLKQARFRYLKRILRDGLSVRPANCVFNRTLEIPDGTEVSFCALYADDLEAWQGLICDDRHGGRELAENCPKYQGRYNKKQLKEEFRLLMKESSIGVIAAKYPDLAALMWVLEDDDVVDLEGFEDEESTGLVVADFDPLLDEIHSSIQGGFSEHDSPSWFRRLFRRLFRGG